MFYTVQWCASVVSLFTTIWLRRLSLEGAFDPTQGWENSERLEGVKIDPGLRFTGFAHSLWDSSRGELAGIQNFSETRVYMSREILLIYSHGLYGNILVSTWGGEVRRQAPDRRLLDLCVCVWNALLPRDKCSIFISIELSKSLKPLTNHFYFS